MIHDPVEGRRQLATVEARIEARQFALAESIVVRVVFEALVQKYLPADSDPRAVNAVAREEICNLVLNAERAAAEWNPPVALTPAASGPGLLDTH
ncbi:hypothetical protein [Catenulispora pinisilvae]|uniref:hypothetical protein n=1 Tax=Catenulispora pinisilvae TaxID=2705253 RepID=UPI001890BEC3|nr:hypothetical protein [Catenulispora pinisilvae]